MAGTSALIPNQLATPNLLGCAVPCPSMINKAGVRLQDSHNSSNAFNNNGPSRKAK